MLTVEPDIHLITPSEAKPALEAALSQNPHLTSLPSPKPGLLTPPDLELTTGTAAIFRFPEVQDAITGDFVVLPCDLVCELSGTSLVKTWMTLQGRIPGSKHESAIDVQGERQSRLGGLGVWYETKDMGEGGVGVKKEETDFLATTILDSPCGTSSSASSLNPHIHNVVLNMTKDTLSDRIDEHKSFRVRRQLLAKHGRVKMLMTHRDAHIYFFPHWVKGFMARNETFESVGEDVLGWWAKSRWQDGLGDKLGMEEALRPAKWRKSDATISDEQEDVDLSFLSSTSICDLSEPIWDTTNSKQIVTPHFSDDLESDSMQKIRHTTSPVPPLLGYLHPPHTADPLNTASNPLIRRIDTVPLLLSCSLYFARQPYPSSNLHAFAHPQQTHPTTTIPPHTTIHSPTVLIDANVSLSPRVTVRECVVGAKCSIASGARLTRCLLMEGTVVEEKAVLYGCVLGRRCRIGKGSDLRDCNVQEGFSVAEGSVGKNEVIAGFAEDGGLEEENNNMNGEIEMA